MKRFEDALQDDRIYWAIKILIYVVGLSIILGVPYLVGWM